MNQGEECKGRKRSRTLEVLDPMLSIWEATHLAKWMLWRIWKFLVSR
jgi:hypothetical protein